MLMEDKRNALQVYNALNNSDYDDPEKIKIYTLKKGVSLTVRNDSAFVLNPDLSIYEHQSTVCPNMPVRFLIYFTSIIEKLLKKQNIYGQTLLSIPTPKFVVFYNGLEEQPEQYEMRLSDAFEKTADKPDLELTCRVYNINTGKNKEFLAKCQVLREYMIFVDYVRYYQQEEDEDHLDVAINRAIDRCIEENVLKEFLIENRSEVVKVMQLDYTFERQIELEREASERKGLKEGRKEGRQEGRKEGQLGTLIDLVRDNLITISEAAKRAEMTEANFAVLLNEKH
jgi:predicted transposase YdaD